MCGGRRLSSSLPGPDSGHPLHGAGGHSEVQHLTDLSQTDGTALDQGRQLGPPPHPDLRLWTLGYWLDKRH
jgi:hypothetical protein